MLTKLFEQRGDTMIEVLLAITIFSLLAVGSLTIMNQSANASQRAIEITLVRQQIDKQVEALRAAHQAYAALETASERSASVWSTLASTSTDTVDTGEACPANDSEYGDSFILNPKTAQLSRELKPVDGDAPTVYPQVVEQGGDIQSYGLWIEKQNVASQGDNSIPGAFDFRIRACWQGVGARTIPQQIETVVRLYDVS